MARINLPVKTQAQAIEQAAKTYGVPDWILMGVYGVETSFGSNSSTSGAGAVGPFQFTAPNKGTGVIYPMTNNPNATQFAQQANAAAAYLASLYKSHGNNWDAALRAYSGGGYGLAQVQGQLHNLGSTWLFALQDAGGSVHGTNPISTTVASAANAVGDTASAVGRIADLVTSSSFWIRFGEAIAGILLLLLGLRALTGGEGNPIKVVGAHV